MGISNARAVGKVIALLEDENSWTKSSRAVTSNGVKRHTLKSAIILKVTAKSQRIRVLEMIHNVIMCRTKGFYNVDSFNKAQTTSHDEMMAVLRLAQNRFKTRLRV